MFRHTVDTSKNDMVATVYMATKNSTVLNVARVKTWNHSRSLTGRVSRSLAAPLVMLRVRPTQVLAGMSAPSAS